MSENYLLAVMNSVATTSPRNSYIFIKEKFLLPDELSAGPQLQIHVAVFISNSPLESLK